MIRSKKSLKKKSPHNIDETKERSLFGDPIAPEITYYFCPTHGKFSTNQIIWDKRSPTCPKCGNSCSLVK